MSNDLDFSTAEQEAIQELTGKLRDSLPGWLRDSFGEWELQAACVHEARVRIQQYKQQRLDAEAMARTSDEEYWKSYTEGAHKQ